MCKVFGQKNVVKILISLFLLVLVQAAIASQKAAIKHFDNAQELLQSGSEEMGPEVNSAIAELEQALQIAPEYVDAILLLGDAYRKKAFSFNWDSSDRKKWRNSAEKHYRNVIQLQPDNPKGYLRLTLELDEKGAEIVETYKKIVLLEPDNSDVHASYGKLLESQGKTNEAIVEYQRHIEINTAKKSYVNEGIYFRAFNLLSSKNRKDEAVDIINTYIDSDQKHIVAAQLKRIDLSSYEDGKYADFISNIKGIKNFNNKKLLDTALKLLEAGKLKEAMERFWQHIETNPYAVNYYIEFATELVKKKNIKEANLIYESLLDSKNNLEDKCRYFRELVSIKNIFGDNLKLQTKVAAMCNIKEPALISGYVNKNKINAEKIDFIESETEQPQQSIVQNFNILIPIIILLLVLFGGIFLWLKRK